MKNDGQRLRAFSTNGDFDTDYTSRCADEIGHDSAMKPLIDSANNSSRCGADVRSVALCVLWLLSGCTAIADADREQCATDTDCETRGAGFSGSQCLDGYCQVASAACPADQTCGDRWACLYDDDAPANTPSSVIVPVRTVFGDPMPGVKARLCRSLDPECDQPEGEVSGDANGQLKVDLRDGFRGYLEITPEGFFPMLYFFPPNPATGSTLAGASLSPTQVIQGLGSAVGAMPNAERGHILLASRDCSGPAAGVSISAVRADNQAIEFYVLDSVPSADLTETTDSGSGGYLNFPPGTASLVLSDANTNEQLATVALIVRPNHISSVAFGPSDLSAMP
jgi:hypothetical protein